MPLQTSYLLQKIDIYLDLVLFTSAMQAKTNSWYCCNPGDETLIFVIKFIKFKIAIFTIFLSQIFRSQIPIYSQILQHPTISNILIQQISIITQVIVSQ